MARPRLVDHLPKTTLGNRSCGAIGSKTGPASPPLLRLTQGGMSCRPDSGRAECDDTDPAILFENVDGLLDLEDTLATGSVRKRLQTC